MRSRFIHSILVIIFVLALPTGSSSDDLSSLRADLNELSDWGELDDAGFVTLLKFSWVCGKFNQYYRAFGLEAIGPNNIGPIIKSAEENGAGSAQVKILQSAFEQAQADVAEKLASKAWIGLPQSEEYQNLRAELVKLSLEFMKMCVLYSKLK